MGEILRAVLEEECVTSRPKFYGARMQVDSNGRPLQATSTFTTLEKQGWFLLTSFYVGKAGDGNQLAGSTWYGLQDFGADLELEDMQSRRIYSLSPLGSGGTPGTLLASYMASPVELPEYILFAPGSRIRWTVTSHLVAISPAWYDICYGGVEYLMPKEASAYGAP